MEKTRLYHSISIDKVELKGNLFLAPMAGFTDKAFRSLALSHGADLCYSEMVSCEAIARENKKTQHLMERAQNERDFALQIFTGSLDSMERCLDKITPYKPTILDLNCGCPVPKVVKTGAGSALMKDIELLYKLVKTMCSTPYPVSVKIRSGWDFNSINYLEAATAIEEAGAHLIAMHPRTRSQGYSGKADWSHLAELKRSCSIPVIGSGDLNSPEDAQRMLSSTAIDGVMFARGAMGNPFIFNQTKELFLKGEYCKISAVERIVAAREHFRLALQYYGERKTCKEIRKHLCTYSKGLKGSSEWRNRVIQCTTPQAYEDEFSAYLERLRRDSERKD